MGVLQIPTVSPTIPSSPDYTPTSPDYTPTSPDYSPVSDTEFDPSEDPSSDHIPLLPATSPFLSSTDDSLDSDTLDTPPSPTHGTPFTKTTLSTQSTPIASGALRRRVMVLAPGQPIPSNRPSTWGIPLVNIGELLEMDPYEEVVQQGQAHPLSPAYVPDPIKLDEHPYAEDALPTAKSPGYIADSDSIEEDTDEDSIDYPDEPEDGEEDDDEDPEEDPSEEHEPEDDDDDDDTDDEDEEPTEDEEEEEHPAPADSSVVPVVDPVPSAGDTEAFETDESAPTPRSPQTRVPFSQTRLCRARKTVRLEPPMSASMEARIAEHAAAPIPPTSPTYDQAPLGHRAAMIRMRDDIPEEDMPPRRRFVLTAPPPGCDVAESSAAARAPRRQYDFVDTVEAGQGLIRSPGHDARTIARAADRAEDVGYVRALQASEHRMMTSIEEVNLRVSY
ncbi:hypothetical protein Tco_1430792 [Tanacetum coccineum]